MKKSVKKIRLGRRRIKDWNFKCKFQSSHGTGHININGETTEIAVILSPVHQKLVILVRGEEEITELMVLKFPLTSKDGRRKKTGSNLRLY